MFIFCFQMFLMCPEFFVFCTGLFSRYFFIYTLSSLFLYNTFLFRFCHGNRFMRSTGCFYCSGFIHLFCRFRRNVCRADSGFFLCPSCHSLSGLSRFNSRCCSRLGSSFFLCPCCHSLFGLSRFNSRCCSRFGSSSSGRCCYSACMSGCSVTSHASAGTSSGTGISSYSFCQTLMTIPSLITVISASAVIARSGTSTDCCDCIMPETFCNLRRLRFSLFSLYFL